MKLKNKLLILGATITLIFAILWYLDKITEPFFAIICALVTLLCYIFVPDSENEAKIKKVKQTHYGSGDNIAGNKIVKNK